MLGIDLYNKNTFSAWHVSGYSIHGMIFIVLLLRDIILVWAFLKGTCDVSCKNPSSSSWTLKGNVDMNIQRKPRHAQEELAVKKSLDSKKQ